VLLDPCLLVPVHSLHDDHSGAAGAGHPRFRTQQIGLRSSGALSHLFPSRSRLHFCCCANLMPVSFSPSPCLYCFAAWLNSQYSSTWSAENFYAPSCSPASGRSLLHRTCRLHRAASDLRGGFGQPEWVLTFSAFFTPSVYSAAPQALSTWPFSGATRKLHSNLLDYTSAMRLANRSEHSCDDRRSLRQVVRLVTAGARAVDLIAARMRLQAFSLSIIDGFLLSLGAACAR